MIAFVFGAIIYMALPLLIVGLWRSRPVAAFITASIILVLNAILPGLYLLIRSIMKYGASNPELIAAAMVDPIISVILSLGIYLPILFLFQWIILRRQKSNKANIPNVFGDPPSDTE